MDDREVFEDAVAKLSLLIDDLKGVNERKLRSRSLSVGITNLETGLLWLEPYVDQLNRDAGL